MPISDFEDRACIIQQTKIGVSKKISYVFLIFRIIGGVRFADGALNEDNRFVDEFVFYRTRIVKRAVVWLRSGDRPAIGSTAKTRSCRLGAFNQTFKRVRLRSVFSV